MPIATALKGVHANPRSSARPAKRKSPCDGGDAGLLRVPFWGNRMMGRERPIIDEHLILSPLRTRPRAKTNLSLLR